MKKLYLRKPFLIVAYILSEQTFCFSQLELSISMGMTVSNLVKEKYHIEGRTLTTGTSFIFSLESKNLPGYYYSFNSGYKYKKIFFSGSIEGNYLREKYFRTSGYFSKDVNNIDFFIISNRFFVLKTGLGYQLSKRILIVGELEKDFLNKYKTTYIDVENNKTAYNEGEIKKKRMLFSLGIEYLPIKSHVTFKSNIVGYKKSNYLLQLGLNIYFTKTKDYKTK